MYEHAPVATTYKTSLTAHFRCT